VRPDEVFAYYDVLVGDLFRREGKRFFVPVALVQIFAIKGTGERHFALRPATDCADIASYRGTVPPGTAFPADLAKYRFRHSLTSIIVCECRSYFRYYVFSSASVRARRERFLCSNTLHYNAIMSVTLSFRTEERLRDEIDQIAAALDRNRNWVINEALADFIELHRRQMEEIRRGEADIRAGRWFTTEQVRGELATWHARAQDDRKRSKAQFKANARCKSA